MIKTGVLLLVVASTLAYPQKDPSLSSEIEQIFGSDKNTSTNAETSKNTSAETEYPEIFFEEVFGPATPGRVDGDTVGNLKGNVISPELFSAALVNMPRTLDWKEQGININGEYIPHLRFANDIVIMAETMQELKEILYGLAEPPKRIGRSKVVHTAKSKACVLTNRHGVCAKFYECEKEVNINDGQTDIAGGIIDIPCKDFFDVCCLVVDPYKNTKLSNMFDVK